MSYKIAIDGPSSAGKSTVAKILAKELGYVYIDTGAMYRTVALYLLKHKIDYTNENEVKNVIDDISIQLKNEDGSILIFLNGNDVSSEIRTQEVGEAASVSSTFQCVREKLVMLQKQIANETSCVMDGRDIASNVLPNANLKIYLTASLECRAKRRLKDELDKGIDTNFERVKTELAERDHRDMNRALNPLIKVDDAILVDTSDMSIDEVVDKLIELATGKV